MNIPGTVCLIDANLRTPSLPDTFGVSDHFGLTDFFVTKDPSEPSQKPLSQKISAAFLQLIGRGLSRSLQFGKHESSYGGIAEAFDYVLIDGPPLSTYADGIALGELADGLVLVLEANDTGATPRRASPNS